MFTPLNELLYFQKRMTNLNKDTIDVMMDTLSIALEANTELNGGTDEEKAQKRSENAQHVSETRNLLNQRLSEILTEGAQ